MLIEIHIKIEYEKGVNTCRQNKKLCFREGAVHFFHKINVSVRELQKVHPRHQQRVQNDVQNQSKHEQHPCKECWENLPTFTELLKHIAKNHCEEEGDVLSKDDKIPERDLGE